MIIFLCRRMILNDSCRLASQSIETLTDIECHVIHYVVMRYERVVYREHNDIFIYF